MNEKFEEALDIASNIAGHAEMEVTALTYHPEQGDWVAYVSNEGFYSYFKVRNIHFDALMAELDANKQSHNVGFTSILKRLGFL